MNKIVNKNIFKSETKNSFKVTPFLPNIHMMPQWPKQSGYVKYRI